MRPNYTYDAENQRVSVATDTYSTPDGSRWKLEFVYDGRGRLRVRKDYMWSSGAWSSSGELRYVYDGLLLVQQRSSANVPLVSYTRGLDLSGSLNGAGGIGGLLARSTHATTSPYAVNSTSYYHADGNGNITYLLRSDAVAYARYQYDPFGRTLSSAGTLATANLLRFSSKPIVLSTWGTWGNYYYGYRFYDPNSQRWLNRDPIGEEGGFNLYGFVGHNPCNWIDSDGRAIMPPFSPNTPYYSPAPRPQLPGYRGGGNCYNYACNRPPSQNFPYPILYPGERVGLPDLSPSKGWNCTSIASRVKSDYPGDPNVEAPKDGKCTPGYHKVRPEVTTSGIGFHFKRQNPDESWSEQLGNSGKPKICRPERPGYEGDEQCPDICVPD